jgi:hypothetical protein
VIAGVEAEIRHVADAREIIANAILSTPGLVIDGKVAPIVTSHTVLSASAYDRPRQRAVSKGTHP